MTRASGYQLAAQPARNYNSVLHADMKICIEWKLIIDEKNVTK